MKSNIFKFYATLIMLFISVLSFADDSPFDPPADDDPVAAPINSYLIWLAIVGIGFVFYILSSRKTVKQ